MARHPWQRHAVDRRSRAAAATVRSAGAARRRPSARGDREDSEFVEKLVGINRVAKVVKGGRRFGFAALVVVGDGKGRVGYGSGKAREVPEAIRKATEQAKRSMIRVPLREGRTLHHDVDRPLRRRARSCCAPRRRAPASSPAVRCAPMFEALGVQDVVAKSVGTSNPHNMIKATFEALERVGQPAQRRRAARQEGRRNRRPPRGGRPRPRRGVRRMAGTKPTAKPRRQPRRKKTRASVTQIGSPIGRQDYQRATLKGLGLNKMHRSRVLEDTPGGARHDRRGAAHLRAGRIGGREAAVIGPVPDGRR